MPNAIRPPPNPVFVIRLWQESAVEALEDSPEGESRHQTTPDAGAWRGEIRNLVTGEVRYFKSWDRLAALIPIMLADDRPPSRPP